MRPSYLVLLAGLSFACGKIDKQEITSTPIDGSANSTGKTIPPAMLVADTASLPACTAANEGQLVFVSSQSVFATCSSTKWMKVDVSGAAATGASGISNAIYCSMTASKADLTAAGLDSVPDGGINFFYSVTQFANNTRYVQARVSSGSFSYSSGIFWTSKQQGYGTALSDNIAFDVNGAKDFGYFYFTADTTVTGDNNNPYAVVYSDPTLTSGKALVFDSKTDCTAQTF